MSIDEDQDESEDMSPHYRGQFKLNSFNSFSSSFSDDSDFHDFQDLFSGSETLNFKKPKKRVSLLTLTHIIRKSKQRNNIIQSNIFRTDSNTNSVYSPHSSPLVTPIASPCATPRQSHSSPVSPSSSPRPSPKKRAQSVESNETSRKSRWKKLSVKTLRERKSPVVNETTQSAIDEVLPEDAAEIEKLVLPTLHSYNEKMKQNTLMYDSPSVSYLQRVLEISKKETNKKIIGKNGMLLFITLLSDTFDDLQYTSLQIIRHLVTVGELKTLFREQGGFPSLIALYHHQENIQKLAAAATGFLLNNNAENAQEFKEKGGIPPLIKLLQSRNVTIQLMAAGVTWVIASYGTVYQDAVREVGGVSLILSLLESTDPEVQWQAAGALHNLSMNNIPIQDELYRNGIVPIILKQLSKPSNEKVLWHTLLALHDIAGYGPVQDSLREASGFSSVLKLLSTSTQITIKDLACGVVGLMCRHNTRNQNFLREKRMIDLLLTLFRTHENLREKVVAALCTICTSNQENLQYLSNLLPMNEVIDLLTKEKDKGLIPVLTILRILLELQQNQELFGDRGVIPTIYNLLSVTENPKLQEQAAMTLIRLCENTNNLHCLKHIECMFLIVHCLNGMHLGVVENVVFLLRTILEKEVSARKVASQLIVKASKTLYRLVNFVAYPNANLRVNACVCLRILSCDSDSNRAQLLLANFPSALLECLSPKCENIVSIEALRTIAVFSANNTKVQNTFKEKGVVSKFMDMLSNENMVIRLRTCEVLWALCINNLKVQEALRLAGGISRLFDMLSSSDVTLKCTVLKVFEAASENNVKTQELIVSLGGVALLLSYLQSEDELLIQYSANTLTALATKNFKVQNHLREVGGLLPLISLIRHPSAQVKLTALITVIAACRKNGTSKEDARSLGICDILQSLSGDVNVCTPLREHVDIALKVFSENESKMMTLFSPRNRNP